MHLTLSPQVPTFIVCWYMWPMQTLRPQIRLENNNLSFNCLKVIVFLNLNLEKVQYLKTTMHAKYSSIQDHTKSFDHSLNVSTWHDINCFKDFARLGYYITKKSRNQQLKQQIYNPMLVYISRFNMRSRSRAWKTWYQKTRIYQFNHCFTLQTSDYDIFSDFFVVIQRH